MSRAKVARKISNSLWRKSSSQVLKELGEVHVWKANLNASDEEVASFWKLLSKYERDRAKRFYFKKDRVHFIKSRATLKTLLGEYLELDPREITFQYTTFGKPFLENESLQFNVSHAGGHGLFAFTLEHLIGVDIEKIESGIEFEKLVSRFFSKNEARIILSLNDDQKAKAFFKCWTRKEAFIKAHGEGLSMPLDRFEVSILDSEKVSLKKVDWKEEKAEDWSMVSFEPEDGWVGALAVKGAIKKVDLFK